MNWPLWLHCQRLFVKIRIKCLNEKNTNCPVSILTMIWLLILMETSNYGWLSTLNIETSLEYILWHIIHISTENHTGPLLLRLPTDGSLYLHQLRIVTQAFEVIYQSSRDFVWLLSGMYDSWGGGNGSVSELTYMNTLQILFHYLLESRIFIHDSISNLLWS